LDLSASRRTGGVTACSVGDEPVSSGVNGPVLPDGKREYAYSDTNAIGWWQAATVANQPYLLPSPALECRRKNSYREADTDDQLGDVMNCVLKARELGLETVVLDQPRSDVGVHVAKVIVPGIRHF
jgi:ribosomal protein S12 methylthiotransferase accessory factor